MCDTVLSGLDCKGLTGSAPQYQHDIDQQCCVDEISALDC